MWLIRPSKQGGDGRFTVCNTCPSYREMYPVREYLFPEDFGDKMTVVDLPNYGNACSHGLEGPRVVQARIAAGKLKARDWSVKQDPDAVKTES